MYCTLVYEQLYSVLHYIHCTWSTYVLVAYPYSQCTGTLPLKEQTKVAVIGPHFNATRDMQGNYFVG